MRPGPATVLLLVCIGLSAGCGEDPADARAGEAAEGSPDAPQGAPAAGAGGDGPPDAGATEAGEVLGDDDGIAEGGPQGGRQPAEGTRSYTRPDGTQTIARSVVLCAAEVAPGLASPLSPQWVSFSDKMAAEIAERPEGCEIGDSDVILQKVNMGEADDGRARCGVGMRGTVAASYRWGYAGASATAIEGALGDFQRLELMTRGDGRLYRIEFLMKEQLDLQCGDPNFNPYGYEFRCGNGDDATIITWDINLDGLQQQLGDAGSAWGTPVKWDPDAVQRVQIRPVNPGGSGFGFDCKFRAHWFEAR